MLKILGNTVQNVVALANGRPHNNVIKQQERREPGHPVGLVTRLGLDWRIEVRFPAMAVTLLSPSRPTKRGWKILQ
jgi:hypothetical protein